MMVIDIVGIVDNFVDKMLISFQKTGIIEKPKNRTFNKVSFYNTRPDYYNRSEQILEFFAWYDKLQKCTKYKLH